MKTQLLLALGVPLCGIFLCSSPGHAQSTAFGYQGQLTSDGLPANGSFDLTFTLFPNSSGGAPFAGPITNAATSVSNGLFTVNLDFGSGVFVGGNYWLEVAVQTNNGAQFTTLSPRQPVLQTPYSVFAWSAATATTAASANTVAAGGAVPLAALPGAVVTNGATNVVFGGSFTGDGGGLTNLNAWPLTSGTNTWTGVNQWLGLSEFASGNLVMGTNSEFFNPLDPIWPNSLLTIFAPSGGYDKALEIYGDFCNGVDGQRYETGFNAGNPCFHSNGGILINGDNSIQDIPAASHGVLAVGQDTPNGYVSYCFYPYLDTFQLFTSPDATGNPLDSNYPNGMETFRIGGNGFTTIWKRGYADLGSMLQLIENDYLATNAYGFDVYPDGLYIGPTVGAGTNASHTNSIIINNGGDLLVPGRIYGDGSGLANLSLPSDLHTDSLTAAGAITNHGNSWLFYGSTNFTAGANAYDFWVTNKLTDGSPWTVVSDSAFAGEQCAVYLEVDVLWCNATNMSGYSGRQRWNGLSYNTIVGGNAIVGPLNAIGADAIVNSGAPVAALTGAGTTNVRLTIANPEGAEINSDYQAHVFVRRISVSSGLALATIPQSAQQRRRKGLN